MTVMPRAATPDALPPAAPIPTDRYRTQRHTCPCGKTVASATAPGLAILRASHSNGCAKAIAANRRGRKTR